MNAIIIAAGSGKRISEDVKDLPKSLLMVNGKPIIVHQIQALKRVGIENIIVITAAHSKKFEIENVK
jgi:NDP-sugar pyrophosphorylase family protein